MFNRFQRTNQGPWMFLLLCRGLIESDLILLWWE